MPLSIRFPAHTPARMNSSRLDPQPDGLNRHAPAVSILFFLLILLSAAGTAVAQGNSNGNNIPSPPIELTREAIKNRMTALDEEGSLDEATRKEITSIYQEALNQLSTLSSLEEKIKEYQNVQKTGSTKIEQFTRQREEIEGRPDLTVPEQAPVDQLLSEIQKTDTYIPTEPELSFLQQELNDRQSELSDAQSSLEGVTSELNNLQSRRENIQTMINEAQDELDDTTSQLRSITPADPPKEQTVAQLTKLHIQRNTLEARLKALNLEKQTYVIRRELLQTRQGYLTTKSNRLEKLVQLLQMVVSQNMERRAKEDLQETRETLSALKDSYPIMEEMARDITDLAEERASDAGPILGTQRITERLKGTTSIRQSVAADLKNVKDRIQAAGLTHQLGSLLRRKKDELPSIQDHRKDIDELEQTLSETQLRLIELNETKSNLIQQKDQLIESKMNKLDADVSKQKRRELQAKMSDLLNRRLGLIEKIIEEYNRYFTKLTDLIAEKKKLVGVLRDYRTYIDVRVIWIRSTSNFLLPQRPDDTDPDDRPVADCETAAGVDATVWHVPEAIRCVLQTAHWKAVFGSLTDDVRNAYPLYVAVLLLLGLLTWYRPSYYDRLREAGTGTFSRHDDSFLKTWNALLYTYLITVPLPGLLLFLGWRLSFATAGATNFAYATGVALTGTGMYYFILSGLLHTCHPEGLGRNHFRWTSEHVQQIRYSILYFLYPTLLPVFLFVLMNHLDNRLYRDALGRTFFIVTMLMIAWFVRRILSPNSGVVSSYLEEQEGGWLDRMRYLWYPLVVCIPLTLGVLALVGYYYTARQLTYRLSLSFAAFLGLLYLVEIFVRWQLFKNIEYAVSKRQERRAEASDEADESSEESTERGDLDKESSFSLPSVNEQTQQLLWSFFWVGLVVSLWLIWADVLPALNMLDEVKLWTYPEQVLETISGKDGQSIQRTVDRQVAITLADVLLGLLIIVMTVIVSKNLPGLLEITLLHYLPMDQGLRYAYKTISRYIIVLLGIMGAASMFGIRWGDIQWLVAGVSVGLGFGLQEIFANFVSGIILLFERPIRVGDTVTVNDVTGKVTRIRTRATTIQDLDRKELVVPNRDFVQGELVNWTLSDSIMRVVIPIGVAYGSDTDLVEKKLMEITRREDIVLNDPEPNVIFTGFGDNALQFSLRFFIEDYDNYWKAFHTVNRAVDKSFKEAGITIAFPQRDLHLKSVHDDVSVSFSADDIPGDPEANGEPPEETGESSEEPDES